MKRFITLLVAAIGGFMGVALFHGTKTASTLASSSKAPGGQGSPAGSSGTGSSASTSSQTATTPVNGTATGKSINYGYGQMTVKVTVVNNKITDVGVSSISTLDAYSSQLEQQVAPVLKSEVLKANGTHIRLITGATYTSEAYATSLQNALNKLHFK